MHTFDYRSVQSIHGQRMAQFLKEKESYELARLAQAGKPGLAGRLVGKMRAGLSSLREALARPVQSA